MAKYVVNSRLSFAINSVVTENLRFRNLPLLQAENRYQEYYENRKLTLHSPQIIPNINIIKIRLT